MSYSGHTHGTEEGARELQSASIALHLPRISLVFKDYKIK
ncbi:hypothetical protein HMPREF1584_01273 [Gardnerella vaginalis JCP8481A]|uniref:Uncharacterized protein n=1 Tax=Gardnerella vaginalis TaxID=2702 RepID=A0A133NQ39_GARVA|nr:hypothetical protein HMPREF1585_01266 [Gardnerella vaginalis JCP8481B]EPI41742.1 hypothetical protein HMPREF1584_01273 [Gardnerella vaginalis JCP8481A]KXA18422.1 hypothetical protein HMPREF3208_01366 [Gardnerella vaginalis]